VSILVKIVLGRRAVHVSGWQSQDSEVGSQGELRDIRDDYLRTTVTCPLDVQVPHGWRT
jgi:hypothetical protein